jgi:hypothetical protein
MLLHPNQSCGLCGRTIRSLCVSQPLLAFLFLALLTLDSLRAQNVGEQTPVGGTISLFHADRDRLIFAADSKISSRNVDTAHMDLNSACKITELDNETLYSYSGGLAKLIDMSGAVTFSAEQLARDAFEIHRREHRSAKKLFNIAQVWGERMKPVADAMLQVHGSSDFQTDLGWGVFGGFDAEGFPMFLVVNMSVTVYPDRSASSSFVIERFPKDSSHPLLPNPTAVPITEFLQRMTARSIGANEIFEHNHQEATDPFYLAHKYAAGLRALILWNPKDTSIGLPIDVVELKRGGQAHWVNRKPACRP